MLNKKTLKVLWNLSIIIIIIITFVIINNKNKITDKFTIRALVIKSGSMYPTLNTNDIIIVKKEENYSVGDIITYNYNNEYLVTHRIVDVKDKGFITKGDNNNCEDEESVAIKNIKGKVILILNKRNIYLGLFIIPIFIIVNIIRKGKRNEENN